MISRRSAAMNSTLLPTQADVAREAGVSAATVSRVLNAPDKVAQDRRLKVETAIRRLGYFPNAAGRALASRRSNMIGLVFPKLNSILFGQFFSEMQRSLDAAGYMLIMTTCEYDLTVETERVRQLIGRGVDAVVLVGTLHAPETLKVLRDSRTPYMTTWSKAAASDLPQIGFCNKSAMARLLHHAADLRHEVIAFISGETKDNDRARDRLQGIIEAVEKRRLIMPNSHIYRGPFDPETGERALLRFCDLDPTPTAILCSSDIFAFGVLKEARNLGIDIPKEMSVMGFDDTELADRCVPALTTLRTPRVEMARRCAESLVNHLELGGPLRSISLDAELIVRESSGPPPDRVQGL